MQWLKTQIIQNFTAAGNLSSRILLFPSLPLKLSCRQHHSGGLCRTSLLWEIWRCLACSFGKLFLQCAEESHPSRYLHPLSSRKYSSNPYLKRNNMYVIKRLRSILHSNVPTFNIIFKYNNSGYIFAMIYIQNKSDKTKDMRVIGTST